MLSIVDGFALIITRTSQPESSQAADDCRSVGYRVAILVTNPGNGAGFQRLSV
jgi:hypothetical protein